MVSNRFLGSIGNAIDSAASGTFLAKRASGPVFETLDYSDISDYPTGANVDSAAIINLIDSNFLSTRTPGTDITTVITDSGLNHIVPDSAGEVVKIGNYSKGISNVFADSGTTIKISSHTIALSTDHILFDGGTAASDYSGGSGAGASSFTWGGDRGIMILGSDGTDYYKDAIDYFDITTAGNATDFGNLGAGRIGYCVGSSTRTLICGGLQTIGSWPSGNTKVNTVEYITTASPGNATDFGDLTQGKSHLCTASNGTRAVIFGGRYQGESPNYTNTVIDYLTIGTTGNASDFGDCTSASTYGAGISNDTYGLQCGGYGRISGSNTNKQNIDVVTIATAANATDFGDLLSLTHSAGGCSDATRGIIAGGGPNPNGVDNRSNVIQYVTVATPSNATDFGDLTLARTGSGTSNGTYGTFCGGEGESSRSNVIDRITIQTLGNATDHGDLNFTPGQYGGAWSGTAA
jgi:hypothetical protein